MDWRAMMTTFGVIFLAEMGDKTQLAAMTLAAQTKKPLAIFIGAAVTDWLDGYLARRWNQTTSFGAFLDPVADKLMVAAALIVLTEFGRIYAIVALIIKRSSPGPVFYTQERMGLDGKSFTVWKFRSMPIDAEDVSGPVWARDDDPRATAVGRWLRKTDVDELPQFWNVLTGDMSVVGWRPIVSDEVRRYGDAFPFVSSLRPGITGLWQVSGRNDVSYDERVRLDVDYRTRPRLRTDVSIMLRTVAQLVRWWDNGAY